MRYAFTIDLTEEEFAKLPILVQRAADLYRNSPEHVQAREQCRLLGALSGLVGRMLESHKSGWLQRQFDHANEVLSTLPVDLKKEVGRVYRTHGDNYPEIEVSPVIKGAENAIREFMQDYGLLPKGEK